MRARLANVVLVLFVGGVALAALVNSLRGGQSTSATPPAQSNAAVQTIATLQTAAPPQPVPRTGPIEAGGTIFFSRYLRHSDIGRGLYAVTPTSGGHDRLVAGGMVCCEAWSPTGRLMFTEDTSPGRTRDVLVGAGGRPRQIVAPGLALGPGVWSPSGDRIAVWASSTAGAPDRGLYLVRTDGATLRRVTRAPAGAVQRPLALSPNGKRLVFYQQHTAGSDSGVLMVVRLGGSPVRLSPPGMRSWCCYFGSPASWSPDGGQIAFATFARGDQGRVGESAVFVAAANGGQRHRITAWGSWTTSARWSPHGPWIAFDRVNRDSDHDLFLVHPDGLGVRLIPSATASSGFCCADWSPNGRALVYEGVPNDQHGTDLWVTNIDGSGVHRLIRSPPGYLTYIWGDR